jgi:hypothetical protein
VNESKCSRHLLTIKATVIYGVSETGVRSYNENTLTNYRICFKIISALIGLRMKRVEKEKKKSKLVTCLYNTPMVMSRMDAKGDPCTAIIF